MAAHHLAPAIAAMLRERGPARDRDVLVVLLVRYSSATFWPNGQLVEEFTETPLPHVDWVAAGGGGGVPPGRGGGGVDPVRRRLTLRTASRRRPVLNVVEAGRTPATSVLC